MTDSLRATASAPKRKPSSAANAGTGRAKLARIPVEQILPDSVREALHRAAQEAAGITTELVTKLDERFSIAEQNGVSRRRLKSYLHRIAKDNGDKPTEADSAEQPGTDTDEKWNNTVRDHRRRQASIAEILEQTFGQFAQSDPALWDRRAYLMLVGLVYERLASPDDELTTNELVALAKVLAQNRHAEARVRNRDVAGDDAAGDEDSRSRGNGELPERFRDIVRQVYGTNFQPPDSNKSREEAGGTETDTPPSGVAAEKAERSLLAPRDADREVGGVGG